MYKDTMCTKMFIAVLCIKAKDSNQPKCSSTGNCLNKIDCILILEYSIFTTKSEADLYVLIQKVLQHSNNNVVLYICTPLHLH